MLQTGCRALAAIGLIAVLLLSTATMAEASMDDAALNFASCQGWNVPDAGCGRSRKGEIICGTH